MQKVTVHNRTTTVVIGDRIRCATTTRTRLVGLLGRHYLEAGEGLWISPSSGVHTFGMRFAIDVVGLDADRRVIRLWPQMQPYRLTSVSTRIRSVLELAGGEIARKSISLGDSLSLQLIV